LVHGHRDAIHFLRKRDSRRKEAALIITWNMHVYYRRQRLRVWVAAIYHSGQKRLVERRLKTAVLINLGRVWRLFFTGFLRSAITYAEHRRTLSLDLSLSVRSSPGLPGCLYLPFASIHRWRASSCGGRSRSHSAAQPASSSQTQHKHRNKMPC
jgi:hypothetical protein